MKTTTTAPDLRAIATAARLRPYERTHTLSKAENAERQLAGRSHYYDAATRRGFGSRVVTLTTDEAGTILGTVESVAPPSGPRIFRAVIFDIAGNTIHRTEATTAHGFKGHSTSRKADKELFAWFDAADPAAILAAALNRSLTEHKTAAAEIAAALATLTK